MPNDQSSGAAASIAAFFGVYLIIILAIFILSCVMWYKIFSKAGYSGWRFLWLFVPIANLVILIMFAFSEWPILRELNALRMQRQSFTPPPYQQGQPQPYQQGQPQQYQSNPQYPQYPPQ